LYALLTASILEVFLALLINYDAPLLILEIISRVHFALLAEWWFLYIYYLVALFDGNTFNSFKELFKYNLFTKALFVYAVLAGVLILIIPSLSTVQNIDINKIIYMPKKVLIISIFVIGLAFLEAIYYLVRNKKGNIKSEGDNSILYVAIISIIIYFVIQSLFKYVSMPQIFLTIFVYLIYFLNENPDLRIIKEINNSQEDIEKSNQTKTDFLSNMSYEIKMPMNLIISLCDELNNMPTYDEAEVKSCMKQVVDAGNNLLDIINNILDISKIETGRETLQEIDYRVNDLISNVINVVKQKVGAKPVKILINIDQSTSSVLHGDSSKLYQSLLNVVSNAAKYTEVGRITITLSSTRSGGNEHLLFKITDTGIGIKDEDKIKMFQKGAKLSGDIIAEDSEGSGLGLVITKQYIENMGGKIWFESQYRVGSTFYIEVEQKIVDATPLGSAVATTTETSDEKLDCSQYKVLIVDDNLLNIKVAKRLLENYKFQIESVTSGKECVDKIKEEQKYDIIFMDHMMPEMDGIETLHVLKKLDGYVLPPIVALTANAIAGMKEMYLKEGFDDYLAKPINTHELERIVNRFFKK
jgi:signal transduction histidine kinase/CheY-like chemotaxis protein